MTQREYVKRLLALDVPVPVDAYMLASIAPRQPLAQQQVEALIDDYASLAYVRRVNQRN